MEDSSSGMSSAILIEILCDNGSLKTVRYGTLLASFVSQVRSAPAPVPVKPQTGHVRPAKKTLAINEHNLSTWSLLRENRRGAPKQARKACQSKLLKAVKNADKRLLNRRRLRGCQRLLLCNR